VKEFGKYIAGTFREFTTVNPLINASKHMDDARWALEDALVKCKDDKAAIEKAINDASAAMWKQLPDAGLSLFRDLLDIRRKLHSSYNTLPRSALEVFSQVSTHMFQIQMRALNALRADFTNRLKAKMLEPGVTADELTIRMNIRPLWRDIIFDLILTMVKEGWLRTAEGLILVATENTLDYFFKNVWSVIVEPIKALANMIPGPLAQLDVVGLAETIVEKIIAKGCMSAFTKIFIKLEQVLFHQ